MLTGVLAGLADGALWGLVFVAPRMLPEVAPVDLIAGRFAAYGVIAAFVMLLGLRKRRLPTWRQAMAALGLSVLGFSGYYLLLVFGIQRAGTEVPTLVIGTIPIWMMLLGKPQRLKWSALLPGLALTLAGLALMVDLPQGDAAASASYWTGIALAVAAMLCWTAFGMLNSQWLKRHPEVNATDWANWLGIATGLGALVLWMLAGSEPKVPEPRVGWSFFAILSIATGFGSTWLATILWNIASQRLSASLCGQLIVSETLFALFYSFAWDGRWPSLAQSAACVLFTLGILASIKAHQ